MKFKLFVFAVFLLWVTPAFADYADITWVSTYDGPNNNYDEANAIAVDNSGNIYVTGYSIGSGTNYDYATIKYLPNGDTAWVRRYNGTANSFDMARAIALDGSGNVYVTGESEGSGTYSDFTTIKYNSSGDTVWVRRYTEPIANYDGATALAVDGLGNVYVTGYSYSDITESYDYLTIKYQPNGDTAWIRRYNGPGGGDDWANALALDGSGNVYVTGRSYGNGMTGEDYATIKYNSVGDTVWVRRYDDNGSSDRASVMASDASENIYVTGLSNQGYMSEDITTIKYHSNGDTVWVRRYNAAIDTADFPKAIIVNGAGEIFVAGRSYHDETNYNYLTIKYHANGDTAWVREYNGSESNADMVYDMAMDPSGNVYVTGASRGGALNLDMVTVKYDPAGRQIWAVRYNGPEDGDDTPHALAVDDSNHVLVTGSSDYSESGGYNYATIKYFQYDSIPFAPAVNYNIGSASTSIFCADLDRDGDIDIATANYGNNNVSILKNNGDGTFLSAVNYEAGSGPISVFCADLDGDGDMDLIVGNNVSDNISILMNNGDGTFQTKVDYEIIEDAGAWSLFCADLDEDSDLDIAVVDLGTKYVSILKNNGDGTFQNAVNYEAGNGAISVFCADLDGDGDIDLAVADFNSNNISILKNNGDGTFQSAVNYGVGEYPYSIFCVDLDGDGDLDLAVTYYNSDNVSILKNNGDGIFQTAVNYMAGNHPFSIFCADLDGDTNVDITVANNYSDNVSILKNYGNGTFQSAIFYRSGNNPSSIFCIDLDGDTDLDLVVTNSTDSISILKNLTQVSANQPPQLFSLVSPTNGDTIFGSATFRWHVPYDPNFGDQIRYDLYISTSAGFEPPFTIINGDLPLSKFNVVLDSGYYYWKVRAYDNWGAERWSTETWSFECKYLDDTLRIIAFSPVDLIVKDPIGDSISLWFNTIPVAFYDTTTDYNQDGDKDDIVTIPNRLVGNYLIEVVAEPGGSGTYELGIRIDGGAPAMLSTPGGDPCPAPGEVDTFTYDAPWYKSGDANGDWAVDVGDVVCLINYLYRNGSVPDPLVSGDATCDGFVDVGDVVFLINYLFKSGPAPSCG
jgi:hypothetical protein